MKRMSDLITRSAAIEVLKQIGIIQDNDLGHLVVDEINRIPTAYDVEKVVAELRKKSMMVATSKKFYENPQNGEYVKEVVTTKDAIAIVRKGGVV